MIIAETPKRERPLVDCGRLKAHQTYQDIHGEKLPGFSAVAGVLDKPALKAWAWKMGQEGKDLYKAQQQAFDIGTCAHLLVECHVNGWDADLGDFAAKDIDQAENSFLKFLDFWNRGFSLIKSEYQMASPQYRYGGTADIVAQDASGRVCLIDVKTRKAVYPEYEMQLCAYGRLWNEGDVEMRRGKPVLREPPGMMIERMICVRIGKEDTGDVEIHEVKPFAVEHYLTIFDACNLILQTKRLVNWK
jgi:hypothetical protein